MVIEELSVDYYIENVPVGYNKRFLFEVLLNLPYFNLPTSVSHIHPRL